MSDMSDEYVAGDVNTLDDDDVVDAVDDDRDDVDDRDDINDRDDRDDAPTDRAATATAVLEFIAKSLADEPGAVELEVTERSGKVIFSLSVGPSDMGRIIGRRGRTAATSRSRAWNSGSRPRRSIILRVLRPSIMRMRFSMNLSPIRQRRRRYCSSCAEM